MNKKGDLDMIIKIALWIIVFVILFTGAGLLIKNLVNR